MKKINNDGAHVRAALNALRTKTTYCKHHNECTRSEDCVSGDFCPYFQHTDAFSSLPEKQEEPYRYRRGIVKELNFD